MWVNPSVVKADRRGQKLILCMKNLIKYLHGNKRKWHRRLVDVAFFCLWAPQACLEKVTPPRAPAAAVGSRGHRGCPRCTFGDGLGSPGSQRPEPAGILFFFFHSRSLESISLGDCTVPAKGKAFWDTLLLPCRNVCANFKHLGC